MSATIPRVARPRGELTPAQMRRAQRALRMRELAEKECREVMVGLLTEGCSFAEVSAATGLSTNTLQRWKREAK